MRSVAKVKAAATAVRVMTIHLHRDDTLAYVHSKHCPQPPNMNEHQSAHDHIEDDPIPSLWQQRERLSPLLTTYGAHILGRALARRFGLESSRTACHKLAALMMALTDFHEGYNYLDFYISFRAEDDKLADCLRELETLDLI
jgi:hypothetical protein